MTQQLDDFDMSALETEIAEETGESRRNLSVRSKAKAARRSMDNAKHKKPRTSPSKKDRSLEQKFKHIMLRWFLPIAACAAIFYTLGAVINSGNSSHAHVYSTVDSLKDTVSVLDQVDSIKDAQVQSMQKQLSAMKDGSTSTADAGHIVSTMADIALRLDQTFTQLLAVAGTASTDDINAAVAGMTATVFKGSDTQLAVKLLAGDTPSKDVNAPGAKAGVIRVSYAGVASDGQLLYIIDVPFATESDVYTAEYAVKIANDNAVVAIAYAGISNAGKASVFAALNSIQ